MRNVRIALCHCAKSTSYRLVRMTDDMEESDPCILWVFNTSNLKVAKKVMKNLNVANVINTTEFVFG